jgi:hypothetical protein
MLPGYNHNVNYKAITFHVQTEDSGVENPHIITLLYIGGNIVARKKLGYADIIKHERMEDVVRELMQEQHKAMLRELKNGRYDQHQLVLAEVARRTGKPVPEPKEVPPPRPEGPLPKPAEKTIELKEGEELTDEDIFGADIISDKSLDEVILAYLAKDLEEEE